MGCCEYRHFKCNKPTKGLYLMMHVFKSEGVSMSLAYIKCMGSEADALMSAKRLDHNYKKRD